MKEKNKRRKKVQAGKSNKIGCQCRSYVTQYSGYPGTAVISYHEAPHINAMGMCCHEAEFQDKQDFQNKRAHAPRLSTWVRNWAAHKLLLKVLMDTILLELDEMHMQEFGGAERSTRLSDKAVLKEVSQDYFLTKQDLGNINHSIGGRTWMEDALPNQSIRMHQPEHQSWYLCYEKQDVKAQKPFIVGLQTDWQCEKLAQFGNGSAVCLDDKSGTKRPQVPFDNICSV